MQVALPQPAPPVFPIPPPSNTSNTPPNALARALKHMRVLVCALCMCCAISTPVPSRAVPFSATPRGFYTRRCKTLPPDAGPLRSTLHAAPRQNRTLRRGKLPIANTERTQKGPQTRMNKGVVLNKVLNSALFSALAAARYYRGITDPGALKNYNTFCKSVISRFFITIDCVIFAAAQRNDNAKQSKAKTQQHISTQSKNTATLCRNTLQQHRKELQDNK